MFIAQRYLNETVAADVKNTFFVSTIYVAFDVLGDFAFLSFKL